MSFSPFSSIKNQWFSRFLNTLNNAATWLYPEKIIFPEDEAGEMMRRILAQKNWLDSLSTAWVEQSFWFKTFITSSICLSFSFIGWAVGAATLLPLTAFLVCAATHCLLVRHHYERIENVKKIVAEIMVLTAELNVSKQLFNDLNNKVKVTIDELENKSHIILQQSQLITEQAHLIKKHNKDIDILVREVQDSTKTLLDEQNKTSKELNQVTNNLIDFDKVIADTTTQVSGIGDATSQLTQSVRGIQNSQKLYSNAAARFSLFVAEQTAPQVSEMDLNLDEIHAVDLELDENELVIEQMKLLMGYN